MNKLAKTPKIPVLHIFHSQDAELYNATVREDKVYLKNEKIAQFSNRGVFTIKDERGRKKKRWKMVIVLDGKAKAGKIRDTLTNDEKLLLELQQIPDPTETVFEPLTDKDRVTVVKREIAKQLGKFKPMETWQFVVIIALLGATLAMQFILR